MSLTNEEKEEPDDSDNLGKSNVFNMNQFNNNDYDQDIIYAQDVESGKDITDITDIDEVLTRQASHFVKKKFAGEEIDEEIDNEQDKTRKDSDDKKKVVEKSPKERFARFDEELGAGAIKRVFRGYDYDTGREIAWNVVNVFCMSEDAISKVQEEIAIIKKLKHPNIINFVSGFFNEEKKEVVIITEIFSSGSLKQYLNRIKHPRLKVIKYWCKEILKGLKYLHELPNPIIHRDIKCDNVFINSTTSEIKLGDLGYSCILSNRDYAKSVSGTPEFMAPEVIEGKYGVLADIYSFGICMLEIVTREKPYKECENNIIDIFENIRSHTLPKSIEKIKNVRLLDFIKSLFKPEAERPTASQLLQSDFLNDLEHEENNFPALVYPFDQDANMSEISTGVICAKKRNLLDSHKTSVHSYYNKISKSNKEEAPNKKEHSYFNSDIIQLNSCQVVGETFTGHSKGNKEETECTTAKTSHTSLTTQNHNNPIKYPVYNTKDSLTGGNGNINRIGDIVGLRSRKNKREKNTIKNEKDYFVNDINSSSDDYDELANAANAGIKNKEDKFKYDPYLVKQSEVLNTLNTLNTLNNWNNFNSLNGIGALTHNDKFNTINILNSQSKNENKMFPPFINTFKHPKTSHKIEIKIEEEYKEANALKISLVKKEKPKHKGQKISFLFDLKNDTCEKILKELENEQIGLNDEEKKYFVEKLSTLINHQTAKGKTEPSQSNNEDLFKSQGKILLDKFFKKHSKILTQAEEILQGSHSISEEIINTQGGNLSQTENEFFNKRKMLEEFIKLCH